MSKVSIYESGWINLVFEGRNKEYGAFQLRQQTARTTMIAFFMGLLLFGSFTSISVLATYLGAKNIPAMVIPAIDEVIHVTKLQYPTPKTDKVFIPIAKKQQADVTTKKVLKDPVIVQPKNADDVTMKADHPIAVNGAVDGHGTVETPVTPITIKTGVETPASPGPETASTTIALDKLPEFPGGIDKFYVYVGRNFAKLEVEDVKLLRVYVSFVIEKDGSMTDIQVRKDPGYGMAKEAIRVLKSLKTKWSPGMIAGKPVRTSYSLPITVQMQ